MDSRLRLSGGLLKVDKSREPVLQYDYTLTCLGESSGDFRPLY